MREDIITKVERYLRIGYSEKLIKDSLRLAGYPENIIEEALNEVKEKKIKGIHSRSEIGVDIIEGKSHYAAHKHQKAEKEMLETEEKPREHSYIAEEDSRIEEMREGDIKTESAESPLSLSHSPKHALRIILEIIVAILFFALVGVLIYLFFLPAVTTPV